MYYVALRGLLLAACSILSTSLFSQVTTFQKAYAGGFRDDCIWGLEINDGYLLAGRARGFGTSQDGLLIRTDQQGKIIWHKNYGGPAHEYFQYAAAANDGGFIALGNSGGTSSDPNFSGAWLVKVADTGEMLWEKFLGDTIYHESAAGPIVAVPGGYIISGYKRNLQSGIRGSFVSRIDNQGEVIWSNSQLTGTPVDSMIVKKFSVQYATDSMLYAISLVEKNAGLISMSPQNGDIIKAIGYKHSGYTLECSGLQPTPDGNFALMGIAIPPDPSNEPNLVWLMKVTPNGHVIWAKAYPTSYSLLSFSNVIKFSSLSDGGFILCPSETNLSGSADYRMLMKLNSTGEVVWKKAYGNTSPAHTLSNCFATSDGGLAAVGTFSFQGSYDDFFLLKTDNDGEIEGCCSQKRNALQAIDFPIEVTPASFTQEQYVTTIPVTLIPTYAVAFTDTSICTIIPPPHVYDTLQFCLGDIVTIGDSTYSQPGTVTILIPSNTGGCDTLHIYTLEVNYPVTLHNTHLICPGDTISIGDSSYSQPGTVLVVIPSNTGGCDTLVYHELQFVSSTVSITCPANTNIQTVTPGAMSAVFNYIQPAASSDCLCSNNSPNLNLTQGLLSGANFPVGVNTVCYSATDGCGNSATCCFVVTVVPQPVLDTACDIKTTGCLSVELVSIRKDDSDDEVYKMRILNNCNSEMSYVAFEVPQGINALHPVHDATYASPSGKTYEVRNPNFQPYHSIRFKTNDVGIASGESDIFEYTLPEITDPEFIHVFVRFANNTNSEVILNTQSCPILPYLSFGSADRSDNFLRRTSTGNMTGEVNLYPNPNNGKFFVDLSNWESQPVSLIIHNAIGQQIQHLEVSDGSELVAFDMGGFNSGIYYLKVIAADGRKQMLRFAVHR